MKNILDILNLGLALYTDVRESFQDDGKLTVSDVPKFTESLFALLPAIEGIETVPAELATMLTPAGWEEIKAFILAKLPDVGEKWKTIAVESLNMGLSVIRIVKAVKG